MTIPSSNALFKLKGSCTYIVYRLRFQITLVLVILNIFCLKCVLYHLPCWKIRYNNHDCNKAQNFRGANALMFKNAGVKLKKDFSHNLTFFQKLNGWVSPNFYGYYGTKNLKKTYQVLASYAFLNLVLSIIVLKKM